MKGGKPLLIHVQEISVRFVEDTTSRVALTIIAPIVADDAGVAARAELVVAPRNLEPTDVVTVLSQPIIARGHPDNDG